MRLIAFALFAACRPAPAIADDDEAAARLARARALLDEVPLIDGHNDTPWQLRRRHQNQLAAVDLYDTLESGMHTDLTRLEAGGMGGQFWSVFVPVGMEGADAVQATLEQIDVVHRMTAAAPELELALTADDVERIHGEGRIASLVGVEGGHCINDSLAVLRLFYDLGARYMTLTHSRNTGWADSATDEAAHGGLSDFGGEVVAEMNRLGMLVDLSHVSEEAMLDALEVSEAPMIFSHSSAFAVAAHARNVPDAVLERLPDNGAVVMINFLPAYVSEDLRQHWVARGEAEGRLRDAHPEDEARIEAGLATWDASNEAPRATLAQVADHIDHVRAVAGIDHVGIGSDYDGIPGTPVGLEGVETYPALFAELMRRGYTDDDLKKIAGLNALRVMRGAEATAARLRDARGPSEAHAEIREE